MAKLMIIFYNINDEVVRFGILTDKGPVPLGFGEAYLRVFRGLQRVKI